MNVDLSLVPVSLRPFITPNIRRLYPRNGKEEPVSQASRQTPESEIASLRAENSALKNNTALWRQRAEVHASATLGLLSLVRSTQLHAANSLKAKKDAECQISTLKRKIEDVEQYVLRFLETRSVQVAHWLSVDFIDVHFSVIFKSRTTTINIIPQPLHDKSLSDGVHIPPPHRHHLRTLTLNLNHVAPFQREQGRAPRIPACQGAR